MKKQIRFFQSVPGIALATMLILLVPLVAMLFTDEVAWSMADFVLAGALLFGTGLSYVLLTRYTSNIVYRAAIGSAIGTTLCMLWANLAVGLIGAGPNPGNLMYIGVLAVVILGTMLSRFTARGMELTMFTAALTLVLVGVIALLANMDQYPGSSVTEIIGVNAFFVSLFALSGLLFRYVAREQAPGKSDA